MSERENNVKLLQKEMLRVVKADPEGLSLELIFEEDVQLMRHLPMGIMMDL